MGEMGQEIIRFSVIMPLYNKAAYVEKANEQDNEDLVNGIVWCLENNKDRTLSVNARNKVLSNYTIDIVEKQYKDLYESLV